VVVLVTVRLRMSRKVDECKPLPLCSWMPWLQSTMALGGPSGSHVCRHGAKLNESRFSPESIFRLCGDVGGGGSFGAARALHCWVGAQGAMTGNMTGNGGACERNAWGGSSGSNVWWRRKVGSRLRTSGGSVGGGGGGGGGDGGKLRQGCEGAKGRRTGRMWGARMRALGERDCVAFGGEASWIKIQWVPM